MAQTKLHLPIWLKACDSTFKKCYSGSSSCRHCLQKTNRCRTRIRRPRLSPDRCWASSECRSSSVILSSLSQSLFLQRLPRVDKAKRLPRMMPRFACRVPGGFFLLALRINCLFFAAFMCLLLSRLLLLLR
jgi:hypothetical protein